MRCIYWAFATRRCPSFRLAMHRTQEVAGSSPASSIEKSSPNSEGFLLPDRLEMSVISDCGHQHCASNETSDAMPTDLGGFRATPARGQHRWLGRLSSALKRRRSAVDLDWGARVQQV